MDIKREPEDVESEPCGPNSNTSWYDVPIKTTNSPDPETQTRTSNCFDSSSGILEGTSEVDPVTDEWKNFKKDYENTKIKCENPIGGSPHSESSIKRKFEENRRSERKPLSDTDIKIRQRNNLKLKKSHKSSTVADDIVKNHKCLVCSEVFSCENMLDTHKATHYKVDSASKKIFMCDLCSYTCTRVGNLTRHRRVHSGQKPYVCDQCEYRCTQSGTLKRHKLIHGDVRPFHCELCDFKCNHVSSLKTHMSSHSGYTPFTCDICGQQYTSLINLRQHTLAHHTRRLWRCDQCEFTCNRSSSLKLHKLRHSGLKPFACDLCTYKCKRLTHLKQHKLVHSRVRPYGCDVCDFKSTQSVNLRNHKKTHVKWLANAQRIEAEGLR